MSDPGRLPNSSSGASDGWSRGVSGRPPGSTPGASGGRSRGDPGRLPDLLFGEGDCRTCDRLRTPAGLYVWCDQQSVWGRTRDACQTLRLVRATDGFGRSHRTPARPLRLVRATVALGGGTGRLPDPTSGASDGEIGTSPGRLPDPTSSASDGRNRERPPGACQTPPSGASDGRRGEGRVPAGPGIWCERRLDPERPPDARQIRLLVRATVGFGRGPEACQTPCWVRLVAGFGGGLRKPAGYCAWRVRRLDSGGTLGTCQALWLARAMVGLGKDYPGACRSLRPMSAAVGHRGGLCGAPAERASAPSRPRSTASSSCPAQSATCAHPNHVPGVYDGRT